jgi:5-(carboxyamino)imidazole ribonucleotide synthase
VRIGVLGGGQLGRMLALEAHPLGLEVVCWAEEGSGSAQAVSKSVVGPYSDARTLQAFLASVDVVTYESENLDAGLVRAVETQARVFPDHRALVASQDRVLEKETFGRVGIPTVAWRRVDRGADLEGGARELGFPCVLKTRRFGYDGKGQWWLRDEADVERLLGLADRGGLVLEARCAFQRELSIVAARGQDGEIRFWPLSENVHREGILRVTRAPAVADVRTVDRAQGFARALLEDLGYVGVLALELFDDGDLRANEMAPRVHNSAHWTQDGSTTSQFENHLRALAGLPLGVTDASGHAAMVNLIGRAPAAAEVLEVPYAHLHVYGKSPRPGRKVGHVNVVHADREVVERSLARVLALVARSEEG